LKKAGEALVSALILQINGQDVSSHALPVKLNIRESSR
jgi:hypothetical protein